MTEARTPYAAGQQQPEPDLPAIEARLAAFAHAQWSGWMRYFLGKCRINEDRTATIPVWAMDRWQGQMNTDYCDLPDDEKASDLEEASGMIEAADLRTLVAEVKRLRRDDAIWDKHSLVQIVTERNELREGVKRLQSLLETEQRAKWAAEQDKQYWQEKAGRLRLQVAQLAEALETFTGTGEE